MIVRGYVGVRFARPNLCVLKIPPNFGAHLLKHDRAGVWSLTVTRNWRMTFRIKDSLEIEEIDLEDYH
jgi:proteic killer suppression protein